MQKKFVMAVVAVAMAAVVGVSAFAAEGTAVPSITGDEGTSFTSQADASDTAKNAYNTIVATEGSIADKLTAVAGSDNVTAAAMAVGVKNGNELSVRAVGDVAVSSKTGEVSLKVAGMKDGETAAVMYLDANGKWVVTTAVVVNGKLTFKLPYSATVIILTKKAA